MSSICGMGWTKNLRTIKSILFQEIFSLKLINRFEILWKNRYCIGIYSVGGAQFGITTPAFFFRGLVKFLRLEVCARWRRENCCPSFFWNCPSGNLKSGGSFKIYIAKWFCKGAKIYYFKIQWGSFLNPVGHLQVPRLPPSP